jgi:hypothetical protein
VASLVDGTCKRSGDSGAGSRGGADQLDRRVVPGDKRGHAAGCPVPNRTTTATQPRSATTAAASIFGAGQLITVPAPAPFPAVSASPGAGYKSKRPRKHHLTADRGQKAYSHTGGGDQLGHRPPDGDSEPMLRCDARGVPTRSLRGGNGS